MVAGGRIGDNFFCQVVEILHVEAAAAPVIAARADFQARFMIDASDRAAGKQTERSRTAGHAGRVAIERVLQLLPFFAFRLFPPESQRIEKFGRGDPQGLFYFGTSGEFPQPLADELAVSGGRPGKIAALRERLRKREPLRKLEKFLERKQRSAQDEEARCSVFLHCGGMSMRKMRSQPGSMGTMAERNARPTPAMPSISP